MKHILITTIAAVVLVGCGPSVGIQQASREGNIEAVKQHIENGTDVNAKDVYGWPPLHWPAWRGHKEIVELLIEKGADVNAKEGSSGSTPLHEVGTKEIAELLIAKGADVNAKTNNGFTALHFAETREIAELLIAEGADVNAKNDDGETPLHYVSRNSKEIVELLIANGADVNAKMLDGRTPLDQAVGKENADLLRKHGGKTGEEFSIHVASGMGNIEAVKQHIAEGADVNAKDDRGWTPLHEAAWNGHKEVAELFLANGADVNAKTGDGRTALDHAEFSSDDFAYSRDIEVAKKETADLLRKHGGKTGRKHGRKAELKAEGK